MAIDVFYWVLTPFVRMKLNPALRLFSFLCLALVLPLGVRGETLDAVARAVAIVQRLAELNTKFAAYNVDLAAPAAVQGTTGKYVLPIDASGNLTEWAKKALTAQVGNIAGEQAGNAAAKGLGSVVPGGGFASGLLKKKGKEVGAMTALGGPEYIKSTSSLSFDSITDYAVYLHAKAGKSPDYSKAVQAAIALYPDLETSYAKSVTAAYEAFVKAAKAAAAPAK